MDFKMVRTLALWGVPALALFLVGGGCKQEAGSSSVPPESESKSAVENDVADILITYDSTLITSILCCGN